MQPFKISKKHHKHINNPIPCPPKTLPFIHGSLSFNPGKVPQHYTFQVGDDFQVNWSSGNGGWLYIAHLSQPKRRLWSTIPGEAFISAAAVQTEVEESRGSFAINDGDVSFVSNHQSIDEIRVLYQSDIEKKSKDPDFLDGYFKANGSFEGMKFPVVMITGWVFSKNKKEKRIYSSFYSGTSKSFCFGSQSRKKLSCAAARYWLFLDQKTKNQIGFKVKFGDLCQQWSPKGFPKSSKGFPKWKLVRYRRQKLIVNFSRRRGFLPLSSEEEEEQKVELFRGFNRVFITYTSDSDERFYGFGEQFSHTEFKGKRVPILVQEQGIGRGDQPITFASNLVSYRSGGDWSTTYAPSPFYMTSKMRSLYLEGYCYSVFDLTKRDRVQIQIYESSAEGRILNGTSPVELIESFTEIIGRPPVLPEWIVSGAVVGMQGGTEAVRRVWDQLQEHDVPISAFWLQDWVGQRETLIGSQLWWNWEVDKDWYPQWKQLVRDLRACGIQVMTYCNPCLVPTDQKMNRERDLFEEAKNLGILVKDNSGDTYMIPNTTFDVGMLDFTHPRTSDWFKNILHEMVDSGVRGWMADFGEGLPLDAHTYSGENAIAAHNRYPELWAKINREFVDEWKSNCHRNKKDDSNDSLVFFMRAGFRGSFKWSMLFWEGDQMVSWQKNDGIKSSVVGLLSSGLSGFALNHSDIGGYCSVNVPLIRYHRSEELLMRWMELNAFSTVFRTHEGNIPSSNCQFYSNRNTLAQFARFAKVFKAWKFYRLKLVKEAAEKGLPVVRHLFLHYPNDEHVHSLSYQQFLVGSEFLVVPVLDRGKKEVKAYFPMSGGDLWQHVWTGRVYRKPLDYSEKNQEGFEAWVDAPIGYPAVFVKFGSSIGETFLRNLIDLNIY